MDFRSSLKKNRFLYESLYVYRHWTQDRKIRKEQDRCERLALEKGLPRGEEDPSAVFSRLRERLALRGVQWPPSPAGRPLHILYAGIPGNWERHNIPPALSRFGEPSCYFLEEQGIVLDRGWETARKMVDERFPRFVEALHARRPVDMLLSYLSGAQISPGSIRRIREMGIPSFSFHMDDRLSFKGVRIAGQWSGPAAVCREYDLNLSNAIASLVKYRVEGAEAIFWPGGANPDHFRPLGLRHEYDVTFCGQRYGERPMLVRYLRKRGVRVDCFGEGWEHGFRSSEDMVRIYNRSRINLGAGFVNASSDQCLKGRDFEIPACGTVYLTSYNENLPRVYRLGEEIEVYAGYEDCAEKIIALLANPERCAVMRAAARNGVLERHTWEGRVRQLLECKGIPAAEKPNAA